MMIRFDSRFPGVLAILGALGLFVWTAIRLGVLDDRALDSQKAQSTQGSDPALVFTSRSETASLRAEIDEGEGFHFPGLIPWKAQEGRLRLLTSAGTIQELTWGQTLADGSTLIDVMSPTVSLDGTRILFAGRKAPPDPGRWRIYEIGVDGKGLKALTGGPTDPGCLGIPPLRYDGKGSTMKDQQRKELDFDDIDPIDLGVKGFAFVSSRIPDLGRDHSRRATQIWSWQPGEIAPIALTANRNNDRWPFLLSCDRIVFSLWSRIREAVNLERTALVPVANGDALAIEPTERWLGARITPNGAEFGFAIKSVEPVWRPRPLFNGKIAFMTPGKTPGSMRLAQADWGYIRSAPSALLKGSAFPNQGNADLDFGPSLCADGCELSAGCPSPAPGGLVLFAGCPLPGKPGQWGIYQCDGDWKKSDQSAPRLLFDDPDLVDAEPVAVYPREITQLSNIDTAQVASALPPDFLKLDNGTIYRGKMGYIENLAVKVAMRSPIPWNPKGMGQKTDPRDNPLIPPPQNIHSIVFYASHRDRFDDPLVPRVKGKLERLLVTPLNEDTTLETWVPSDPMIPTLLAGLDEQGKIATWSGTVASPDGKPPTHIAFAGDHYSGSRGKGYQYCNGCHAGHTFLSFDPTERTKAR